MDILVIIWIVVFIGGRILTSVARREQRQLDQQTTPLSNDELEYRTTVAASQPVTPKPQQRNAGAQQNRNQSARMRQEMAQQYKNQTDRGQKTSSVKDYIERMSGPQKDSPVANRVKKPLIDPVQQQMSMGYDQHEEIDWDNYEANFMANSEWASNPEWNIGEEDVILGVSDLATLERQTTPVATAPKQAASELFRPDAMKKAIIVSEILAKPKSLRRP